MGRGGSREALARLDASIERRPTAEKLVNRADRLLEIREPERALVDAEWAVFLDASSARAHACKAAAHLALAVGKRMVGKLSVKQTMAAMDAYCEALERDPSLVEPRVVLDCPQGRCYQALRAWVPNWKELSEEACQATIDEWSTAIEDLSPRSEKQRTRDDGAARMRRKVEEQRRAFDEQSTALREQLVHAKAYHQHEQKIADAERQQRRSLEKENRALRKALSLLADEGSKEFSKDGPAGSSSASAEDGYADGHGERVHALRQVVDVLAHADRERAASATAGESCDRCERTGGGAGARASSVERTDEASSAAEAHTTGCCEAAPLHVHTLQAAVVTIAGFGAALASMQVITQAREDAAAATVPRLALTLEAVGVGSNSFFFAFVVLVAVALAAAAKALTASDLARLWALCVWTIPVLRVLTVATMDRESLSIFTNFRPGLASVSRLVFFTAGVFHSTVALTSYEKTRLGLWLAFVLGLGMSAVIAWLSVYRVGGEPYGGPEWEKYTAQYGGELTHYATRFELLQAVFLLEIRLRITLVVLPFVAGFVMVGSILLPECWSRAGNARPATSKGGTRDAESHPERQRIVMDHC